MGLSQLPFVGVRRFPRRVRAALGYKHVLLEGWTRDLSMGGAFVETLCRLPADAHVTIRLELPDAPEPILIPGEVRWSRPGADRAGGMGLRFERLDEEQANALYRYLQPPRAGVAGPPRPEDVDAAGDWVPDYVELSLAPEPREDAVSNGIPEYAEYELANADTDRIWPPGRNHRRH